jgi:hypothetical protein
MPKIGSVDLIELSREEVFHSPASSRPYLHMTPVIEPTSDKHFGTQKRFFQYQPEY